MHARMTLQQVMVMLAVGLVSACSSPGALTITQSKTQGPPTAASADTATQSPLRSTAPSPVIEKWQGVWEANRPSQAHGQMEMEFEAEDGDRVTGRVRATFSAATNCSLAWERFTGTKSGERVSGQYDLGGRCGKVDVILLIDSKEKNLLAGTYTNEYSRSGTIRLTRQ